MDTIPVIEDKYALQDGQYSLVSWSLVTTGGGLNEDICQIVGYSPGFETYSQHVMPYHNLSAGSRRKHSLCIISSGRFRVLKDMRSNKTLRTKSDFAALNDFMTWLQLVKAETDGVILVTHDPQKISPSILVEILDKYDMTEKFCAIVKGFANLFVIAEQKYSKAVRSYSINVLNSIVLRKDEDLGEASLRTKSIYDITEHILAVDAVEAKEKKDEKEAAHDENLAFVKFLLPYCYNIDGINKITSDLKALQERENSLVPLFDSMRTSRAERQRSFNLQRLLARSNIDYEILSDIYKKGGLESINEVLKCTMAKEHDREFEELKHLFALHFDPSYKGSFKPVEKTTSNERQFRRNSRSKKKNNNTNGQSSTSSETTVSATANKTVTDPGSPSEMSDEQNSSGASYDVVPLITVTSETSTISVTEPAAVVAAMASPVKAL